MSSESEEIVAPLAEDYVVAFREIRNISDRQIQMLRFHYHAPQRKATARELARAAGYPGDDHRPANSQYGRLAKKVGEQLDFKPSKDWLSAVITSEKPRKGREWQLIMRREVAGALELLGWIEGNYFLLPEEIAATTGPLLEGPAYRVMVNAYERNAAARRQCIEHYGPTCCICGFSFGAVYGEVIDGFIHVHHLRPLAEIDKEYQVDPIEDLRPVCANCHAVLHSRIPAYSIEDVIDFVRQTPIGSAIIKLFRK